MASEKPPTAPAASAHRMLAREGKAPCIPSAIENIRDESADVRERGQDEGVGTARAVSSGEVGRAPEKYGGHGERRGRELGGRDTPDESSMAVLGAAVAMHLAAEPLVDRAAEPDRPLYQ